MAFQVKKALQWPAKSAQSFLAFKGEIYISWELLKPFTCYFGVIYIWYNVQKHIYKDILAGNCFSVCSQKSNRNMFQYFLIPRYFHVWQVKNMNSFLRFSIHIF